MKLRYLIMLFIIILLTNSAKAVEVYTKDGNELYLFGKLNSMRYISNDNSKNTDCSFVYYGLNGKTQLSKGINGFGKWEQGLDLSQTENESTKNNFTRLGFVGVTISDIGSINYGRNYGIMYDIGSWTDIMPGFGNNASVTDNFMTGRVDSVFTYRNTNFFKKIDGLNFAFQYQGKNYFQNKKQNVHEVNGDGYGLSIIYDFRNGISAGAAYINSKRTPVQHSSFHDMQDKNKRAEAYSIGLKNDINNFYFAALYNETYRITSYSRFYGSISERQIYKSTSKDYNFELIAQYTLNSGLCPSIRYMQSCINSNYKKENYNIKKYIEVGANYVFNKNMSTFFDYQINLLFKKDFLHKTHINANNILALGISYTF